MAPPAPLQLTTGELAALAVFGVLGGGTGSALLVDGLRRWRYRRRAREEFVRVDATVLDAALHEPATGGSRAVPHVEYEYNVDGETYVSRSLWPTRSASPDRVDRRVARRVVEDHPAGAEIIARYDPEDPGTSYLLEQFDATGERVELVLGALLIAAFVGLAAALSNGTL